MVERIQKFLAHQGLASRRQVDAMLQEGRISVNGKPAKPGDRVAGDEKIALDDKLIRINRTAFKPRLLMYHKPVGEICTRADPEGRASVFSNLPSPGNGRWVGIGRLDINTSGLILFTDQGELANRLMHPSFEVEREYAVRVHGVVTSDMLLRLEQGVMLDDGIAKFDQILDSGGEGSNHWYHVILREGRNREVRRLWESLGVEVSRLVRVRYDQFNLPKWLKPGKHRFFEDNVIEGLYQRLKLEYPRSANQRRQTQRTKRR
ncbi:MAG: pseudouridine synthase [Gammaproteobacteria bacterium]|nr:pseudouridine synthase [Gammaproteobacteria bacterium]